MGRAGAARQLRGIGRRIAAAGYYAAVPDLYHRLGEGITFEGSRLLDPESGEMERMVATTQRVSGDEVMADTRAALDEIDGESLAGSGAKGCVGFCFGGRFVVPAMASFPDEFASGSALHPSGVLGARARPSSSRAGSAASCTSATAAQTPFTRRRRSHLRAELERHGIRYLAEVHEGAAHGYMIPATPVYHEQACERSWERTFDLFRRTLQEAPVTA